MNITTCHWKLFISSAGHYDLKPSFKIESILIPNLIRAHLALDLPSAALKISRSFILAVDLKSGPSASVSEEHLRNQAL